VRKERRKKFHLVSERLKEEVQDTVGLLKVIKHNMEMTKKLNHYQATPVKMKNQGRTFYGM